MLLLTVLCLLATLYGCAAGMAAMGKWEPDLSVCTDGADRKTVEEQLGVPVSVTKTEERNVLAVYEYEAGNEPDSTRSNFHAAMSSATLGVWDVIGVPYEMIVSWGKTKHVRVVYNKENKVVKIDRNP